MTSLRRKARQAARKRKKQRDAVPGARTVQMAEEVNALIGLYRAGRFGEVADRARAFTTQWPRQAVGWNLLAVSLQDLGRSEEAVAAYRRALKIEPGNVEARNNLGNALRDLGRAEEAETCYREVLSAQPGHAGAQFNLALALLQERRQWRRAVSAGKLAALAGRPTDLSEC